MTTNPVLSSPLLHAWWLLHLIQQTPFLETTSLHELIPFPTHMYQTRRRLNELSASGLVRKFRSALGGRRHPAVTPAFSGTSPACWRPSGMMYPNRLWRLYLPWWSRAAHHIAAMGVHVLLCHPEAHVRWKTVFVMRETAPYAVYMLSKRSSPLSSWCDYWRQTWTFEDIQHRDHRLTVLLLPIPYWMPPMTAMKAWLTRAQEQWQPRAILILTDDSWIEWCHAWNRSSTADGAHIVAATPRMIDGMTEADAQRMTEFRRRFWSFWFATRAAHATALRAIRHEWEELNRRYEQVSLYHRRFLNRYWLDERQTPRQSPRIARRASYQRRRHESSPPPDSVLDDESASHDTATS